MSATRRSWEFYDVRMAIRTSFPCRPPDWQSHGTFGMGELDDRIEGGTQDHVEFGSDIELESEIEAIVGALEPTEESDAIEVLPT